MGGGTSSARGDTNGFTDAPTSYSSAGGNDASLTLFPSLGRSTKNSILRISTTSEKYYNQQQQQLQFSSVALPLVFADVPQEHFSALNLDWAVQALTPSYRNKGANNNNNNDNNDISCNDTTWCGAYRGADEEDEKKAVRSVRIYNLLGRGGGRFKHFFPSLLKNGDDIIPLLFYIPSVRSSSSNNGLFNSNGSSVVMSGGSVNNDNNNNSNRGAVFAYRITSMDGSLWKFHNDTVLYELEITYVFSKNSQIQAMGFTTMRERSDGRKEARLKVHPGETQKFICGYVEHYEQDIKLTYINRIFIETSVRECEHFIKEDRERVISTLSGSSLSTSTDNKKRKGKKYNNDISDDVTSEEVYALCVQENVPFFDFEFPPNTSSLIGKPRSKNNGERKILCGWCKPKNYIPKEMLKNKIDIFHHPPNPMTVGMSVVGGQGVINALTVLAEDYNSLKKLFRFPTGTAAANNGDSIISTSGKNGNKKSVDNSRSMLDTYSDMDTDISIEASRVTLCKNGWWTCVIVDHYFPVLNMKLLGGKCIHDSTELWVSVIEKAYAKLRGSYTSLSSIDALKALQELTGYPTCRFDSMLLDYKRQDELFDKLQRFYELGFIIVLDKPNMTSSDKHIQRLGLQEGIVCNVLNMKMFEPLPIGGNVRGCYQEGATTHRLVRMRNAFGSTRDWIGKWNLYDPAWQTHPAIALECEYRKEEADDGSIWMEWRDVVRCFHGCGVCFTHSSFYEYRVKGEFEKDGLPSCVIKLEVSRQTYVLCVLYQAVREEEPLRPLLLQISRRYIPAELQRPTSLSIATNIDNNNDDYYVGDGDNSENLETGNIDGRRRSVMSEKTKKQQRRSLSKKHKNYKKEMDKYKKHQEVFLNSTFDCDCPSPDLLTFRAAPQVSFITELRPEFSPYYLIPRTTEETTAPYVLGLFTSFPCGGETADGLSASTRSASMSTANMQTTATATAAATLQAKFMRLPPKTKVFSDTLRFEVTSETAVKCQYQMSSPTHLPSAFPMSFTDKCIR